MFITVPQQGDVFHAAPDRGALFPGGPRWSHSPTLLDHQSQETPGVPTHTHKHTDKQAHSPYRARSIVSPAAVIQ